jgi:hypothetical protein
MIVALLALFVALGGPAQAAKLIDGERIKPGTIASKQVEDRSLKLRDLGRNAIGALTETPDGSVGTAQIAENAVTTQAIAPDSVLTGNVADNSLTTADLGANAVGNDEVSDNAIGQSEIRTNGVSASEIADNSIDGGEIVDGGLSIRDLAREVGTLDWTIPPLGLDKCHVQPFPVTTIQVGGDFVLVSPVSAWPRDVVYTVNGTGSESEFKLEACNRNRDGFAGGTYRFNFAVLGF